MLFLQNCDESVIFGFYRIGIHNPLCTSSVSTKILWHVEKRPKIAVSHLLVKLVRHQWILDYSMLLFTLLYTYRISTFWATKAFTPSYAKLILGLQRITKIAISGTILSILKKFSVSKITSVMELWKLTLYVPGLSEAFRSGTLRHDWTCRQIDWMLQPTTQLKRMVCI